jgi:toxin ParE1/3/4
MYSYYLSSEAKEDLRRIYYYGVGKFGVNQADNYFNMFYDCFDRIEGNPFLFPSADHIKKGYGIVFVVLILFTIKSMGIKG